MWRAVSTPGSKTYYYHTATNETVWEKPKDLWTPLDHKLAAQNWTCYETDEGKAYWYNTVTKTSVWDCPIKEKSYKELCAEFTGVPFTSAMKTLAEHQEYWDLEFAERVRIFETATKQVSEEQLRDRVKGYISAQELLDLCQDSRLVHKLLKEYSLSAEVKKSLAQALESETLEDLNATEEKLHQRLQYPRDPKLIEIYKARLEELQRVKQQEALEKSKQLETTAAKARLAFLGALAQHDLNLEWADLVPKLKSEIMALDGMPGSSAAQLFNEAKAAYLSDMQSDLSTAKQALLRANKSIDRLTPAQFEKLVPLKNPKRVYEQLNSTIVKKPKLDILEY